MKTAAIFYHAGCPVCVEAENQVADALDPARYDVEHVHLACGGARRAGKPDTSSNGNSHP